MEHTENDLPPKDRMEADAQFKAVCAELEGKIEELARANLELYESARRKSEFVANMSHELRTPLNSIIGFADVLLAEMKDSATEDQVKYLKNIRQAGYRLLEILSELLAFAKLESGQARVHPGPTAIPALVSEVANNLKNGKPRKIDFRVEAPAAMPTIMTDEIKVTQILQNLGNNAVKFTPDGGSVTFRAALDGTTLTLAVADTGIGIEEKDKARVFEQFHQLDAGITRQFEGVGLGLYIVDSLVRLLGGKIDLQSEVGKGSTFTVAIPVELIEI